MSLLIRWLLNSAALFAIAYFAKQYQFLAGFDVQSFQAAIVAVAILGILNLTVKPLLKLLTLPITCLTFGLFTLVINALMMLITGQLVQGFVVGGFLNAFFASIIFAILSTILNMIFNPKKDEDD